MVVKLCIALQCKCSKNLSFPAQGCFDIPDPSNGNVVFMKDTTSPFAVGTTATYKCDPGYVVEGEAIRVCEGMDIVNWSGMAAVCTRKYNYMCAPIDTENLSP